MVVLNLIVIRPSFVIEAMYALGLDFYFFTFSCWATISFELNELDLFSSFDEHLNSTNIL